MQLRSLLRYAAAVIAAHFGRRTVPLADEFLDLASIPPLAGCFITWKTLPQTSTGSVPTSSVQHRVLRGCMGQLHPARSQASAADEPVASDARSARSGVDLSTVLPQVALSATLHDPRFPPIEGSDLDQYWLGLSALGMPRSWPAPRDPADLVLGREGLRVAHAGARGVLLPQVAVEHGFTAAGFLAATCRKAGLDPDSWQQAETLVERFPGWADGVPFRELDSNEARRGRG